MTYCEKLTNAGGAGKQAELLEADGVEVINGKVDLKKYGMNIYL